MTLRLSLLCSAALFASTNAFAQEAAAPAAPQPAAPAVAPATRAA